MRALVFSFIIWKSIISADAGTIPETFTHPGIFTSQPELAVIQKRVASANLADAIFQGWKSVLASKFADLNFVSQPMPIVKRLKKKNRMIRR